MALYKHHYPNDKLMPRKLKIIFDATPMLVTKTGVAYYTERLVTQLAAQYPDEVELVGFYYNFLGRRNSSHLPRAKNLNYTHLSVIPSKIVFQLRRWGIEIPIEFLALQRADFILYNNFLGHPSLFHTPSAPVIHDITYHDLPDYVSPKLRRDLERFVPTAIKRAAFVITVSDFSKQRLTTLYDIPADDVLVTPIPPPPTVRIPEQKRQVVLKRYGLTKPFVFFVGTIDPRKNIIGLIEGFMRLPKHLRETHALVLAGRVERFAQAEEAALRGAVKQGHNIVHLGYITDEAKDILYQSATAFAHASQYEGFGMPVLEAMNYGLPCVLSDIPVFREVGGQAAAYFDRHNPKEIAEVLQSVLESKHRQKTMSELGKARAASYTWGAVAQELFERIKASAPNT